MMMATEPIDLTAVRTRLFIGRIDGSTIFSFYRSHNRTCMAKRICWNESHGREMQQSRLGPYGRAHKLGLVCASGSKNTWVAT